MTPVPSSVFDGDRERPGLTLGRAGVNQFAD